VHLLTADALWISLVLLAAAALGAEAADTIAGRQPVVAALVEKQLPSQ
jgi:hypothetical protein